MEIGWTDDVISEVWHRVTGERDILHDNIMEEG